MTVSAGQSSTPLISTILDQFNEAADRRIDHIFWRLFQLLVATGVIIIVILVIGRITRRRAHVN